MSQVTIQTVSSKSDWERFIFFPWEIYKNDPVWVAPLKSSYRKVFQKDKNPFFQHGEMEAFVALKQGKVVGRVAAIINHLHNETWKDQVGFFGFFECVNDVEVSAALLDAARAWLKERNYTHMRGPASPSSNEDYGVMIDGFDEQHVILSTYNARWYYSLYAAYGLQPIKKLFAFRFDGTKILEKNQERIDRIEAALKHRLNFELVNLDMKRFDEGVKTFRGLFNKAWTTVNNHGWVPLTDAEFDHITTDLKQITDPNLVMLAKVDGEVVGGCICLPDYNEVFRSWKGNLLPFNWIDMFTKAKKIKCVRIVILGVLPEYQRKGLDALMYLQITKHGMERGATWAEASYIVEDNEPMKRPLLNIGGEIYKTYQVMEMPV